MSERIRRCPVCDRPIFNNALHDHASGCPWPGTTAAHVEVLSDAFADLTAEVARPVLWLAGRPRLFRVILVACFVIVFAILTAAALGLIPTEGCGPFRRSFCR